jgi:hypothetical protein
VLTPTFVYFSKKIIVIQGGPSSSSQNIGSIVKSHNQSHPTSPRGDTASKNMVGVDNTLSLSNFQGTGSEDP